MQSGNVRVWRQFQALLRDSLEKLLDEGGDERAGLEGHCEDGARLRRAWVDDSHRVSLHLGGVL